MSWLDSWLNSPGVKIAIGSFAIDGLKDHFADAMGECPTQDCCKNNMARGLAALQGGMALGMSTAGLELELPPLSVVTALNVQYHYFHDMIQLGKAYNDCMEKNKPCHDKKPPSTPPSNPPVT